MSGSAVKERDYFRSLLELATHEDPELLLERAMRILVELSGAREAYIELCEVDGSALVQWRSYAGCDEARADEIRDMVSRGIIAEALATGEAIITASALTDPRFRDRGSVKNQAIESVLCAPFGSGQVAGVIYLQGQEHASDFTPFSDALREQVALLTRTMRPLVAHLAFRARSQADPFALSGAFAALVTRNRVFHRLGQTLQRAASLDVDILLSGPTGTGKTLLARAIHRDSPRSAKPFVELNCAAIPDGLLESELFGAVRGAHSAVAHGGTVGKVEQAEGGTLFLDELGELSLSSQSKILQLLQDRVYYRLGSPKPSTADIRVVAATNVELPSAVKAGRFREDLYYRLKIFEAELPSLDERPEDIAPLAMHFAQSAAARHDLPPRPLSPEAIDALCGARWPGNVRELAHRVESGLLHAHIRGANYIDENDVMPALRSGVRAILTDDKKLGLQHATKRFQRRFVERVLTDNDWNVAQSARDLGVARSHLYTLMHDYGLRRDRKVAHSDA